MRFLKWIVLTLKWCALGLIPCIGAWMGWNSVATMRVERVAADLKSRGLPTTIAELERGLPPYEGRPVDEENAALLYEEAFELAESIAASDPQLELDWNHRRSLDVPAALRRSLPRFEGVFQLICRGNLRPRCRFERDWRELYPRGLLSHHRGLTRLASLLQARAVVRAEDGDVDAAIEDVRALFNLSRALREEPVLMSQYVRRGIAGRALTTLEVILPRCPSAVEALKQTSPDAARHSTAFGLQGTIVRTLSMVRNEDGWRELTRLIGEVPGGSSISMDWDRAYLKSDVAQLAKSFGRLVEIAREPYVSALRMAEDLALEMQGDGRLITAATGSMIDQIIPHEARHATRIALAELAAKCIDYRHEHGEYPARLDVISDGALDPMTGIPFSFERGEWGMRLRGDGFLPHSPDEPAVWPLPDSD